MPAMLPPLEEIVFPEEILLLGGDDLSAWVVADAATVLHCVEIDEYERPSSDVVLAKKYIDEREPLVYGYELSRPTRDAVYDSFEGASRALVGELISVQLSGQEGLSVGFVEEAGVDAVTLFLVYPDGSSAHREAIAYQDVVRLTWGGGELEALESVARHRQLFDSSDKSALLVHANYLRDTLALVDVEVSDGSERRGFVVATGEDYVCLQVVSVQRTLEEVVVVPIEHLKSLTLIDEEDDPSRLALFLSGNGPPTPSQREPTFNMLVESLLAERVGGLHCRGELYVVEWLSLREGKIQCRKISATMRVSEELEIDLAEISQLEYGGCYLARVKVLALSLS